MLTRWIRGIAPALALAACPGQADAQPASWKPVRNVEIVVGAGPGGAIDITGRAMQRAIFEHKLIPVSSNVVNKPGGGGAVAAAYLNQHQGDGHYLLVVPIDIVTNAITGRAGISRSEVTAVANLISEPAVFSVNPRSPLKSAKDVIERLKADPASLSFAISPNLGGANHIAIGIALKAAGVDVRKLKIVTFDSAGAALAALLGGHVDVVSSGASGATEAIAAGQLLGIAVTSPTRLPGGLSRVPTLKEAGVDAVAGTWRIAVGPREMTPVQVHYWESVLLAMSKTPSWRKSIEANLWDDNYMPGAQTEAFLDREQAKFKSILTDLGLAK